MEEEHRREEDKLLTEFSEREDQGGHQAVGGAETGVGGQTEGANGQVRQGHGQEQEETEGQREKGKGMGGNKKDSKQEAQRATYLAPEYNVPTFGGIGQGGHFC